VFAVLPSGGKVVRLEELEAAQLSPVSKQLPLVPGSSSTPADTAPGLSVLVTRDTSTADTRGRRMLAPARGRGGPSRAHVPPGPAPALPAGAQTLEQIEAGLQNMTLPPSPSSVSAPAAVNAASGGASAAAAAGTNGDLTAFNKLLHLVKSQPNTDQVYVSFHYCK